MNLNELLDLAKTRQNIESDNALAKALGVTRQRVSSWRNGHRHPEPVTCAAIAGLTGEPLARVIGIVGEARAISREEKAVWRKLAATAALVLLVALPWSNPAAAYTRTDGQNILNNQQLMYYAKYWMAKVRGQPAPGYFPRASARAARSASSFSLSLSSRPRGTGS